MKVSIMTDDGSLFSFDSSDFSAAGLSAAARAEAAAALKDMADKLATVESSVVGSIKADIQAAVARVETELGAHPAFTWAQTKLSNAIAHLEQYAAGIWTEPPVVHGVATDDRGVIVAVAPAAPTIQAVGVVDGFEASVAVASAEAPPAA